MSRLWNAFTALTTGMWRVFVIVMSGLWRAFAILVTGLWRAFVVVISGLWRGFVITLSWVPQTFAIVRFWLRRTSAIVDKEMRQLARERLTLGMIIGLPLLQVLLFGYAINTDVRHLRAGIVDHAATSMSRQLANGLEASQVVDFVQRSGEVGKLLEGMRRGELRIILYIPADFERRLSDGTRPLAQLLVDGTDPAIVNVAQRIADFAPSGRGAKVDASAALAVRTYYNPERRSSVQIVPALVGVILNLAMMVFTALAVVRERERGNLEFLITTPVRNYELMLGKITPYILIGLAQVTIVFFVGSWLFRVPMAGSLVDLYLGSLLFVAATLGVGLTISTFARSQFQAVQIAFFFLLPTLLLSGFMFPFNGMPKAAQWIAYLFPLTHFVEVLRGVILRGATLAEMSTQVYALLALFALTMLIAVLRFTKRLD